MMGYTEKPIVQASLYDRVSQLLESYEWSDCSFYVSGKHFKAHRLILGISSPVFKAMLYGPLSNTEEITVPDIEPDVFQEMLSYIYTDKVDLKSIEYAFELLYAAKKYLIECLEEKCVKYIQNNMSVDNVISVLTFSEYIQEDTLISSACTRICEHAEYLLQEHLDKINCSCLRIILASNEINISEWNLITAVLKWTNYYCKLNNEPVTKENRRKALFGNNLLRFLRFSTLSKKELNDVLIHEDNILDDKEIEQLKKTNTNNDDTFEALGIDYNDSDIKCRETIKVKYHICHRSCLRSAAPLVVDSTNNKITVRVITNKTVFINALGVPTRMSPQINFHNTEDLTYAEQFTVSIKNESQDKVVKYLNFMNTVEYDSNIFIDLSETCIMKKDEWYQISFMWPCNRSYSYKYIAGYRSNITSQRAMFQFEDLTNNGAGKGSFLEALKFSL